MFKYLLLKSIYDLSDVDATHTKSRYNQKTPRQALQEQSKKLRRVVYEVDETIKGQFPAKNTENSLEKELDLFCSVPGEAKDIGIRTLINFSLKVINSDRPYYRFFTKISPVKI